MSIAILVRHGESEANVRNIVSDDIDGYPLTVSGREQASLAAEQLSSLRIKALISSPVQRTRETASIISGKVGKEPLLDNRIIETGMGVHNNKVFTDIPKMSREELGMESWESHKKRLIDILEKIEGTSVLVSHAFPIRSALSVYLDLDELESYGINIRYASISVIDLESSDVLCIGSRYLSEKVKRYIMSNQ